MALQNATQGATHTGQVITWTRDDGSAQDLTGAALTGTITSVRTGISVAIGGTLTALTPLAGILTWAYNAADVLAAGEYRVQILATYSGPASDATYLADWLVLPIASSDLPRASMSHLIHRVRKLCGGDSELTDFDYLELLDDYAFVVDAVLEPQPPFYTSHQAPFENWEIGAAVYFGWNSLLAENTDYTIDYQRGIITTPAANYQGLKILGKVYDIHAAAADGWDRIAQRNAGAFDWSDVEGSYKPSQIRDFATTQAKAQRRKAWAIGRTVERADTPVLPGARNDWRGDLLRRERAGYGTR